MKIKITTFNCLAWRWAKKHRTLAAFKPEVANWTEKEWEDWEPYLDDWQLPDRYENYIKFFLKQTGFFCLQEVDHELSLLLSKQVKIFVVSPQRGAGFYSNEIIGNMIVYVGDGSLIDYPHLTYDPLRLSVMYGQSGVIDNKPFNLTQINLYPGKTFWLLNIHAPGFNRKESDEASKAGVERIIGYLRGIKLGDNPFIESLDNLIIGGDFNVDIERDLHGEKLVEYLGQFDLSVYPLHYTNREIVTEPTTGTTIDYIWINPDIAIDIDPKPEDPIAVPGSDHMAVSISFEM